MSKEQIEEYNMLHSNAEKVFRNINISLGELLDISENLEEGEEDKFFWTGNRLKRCIEKYIERK